MIPEIVLWPDDRLTQVCDPVTAEQITYDRETIVAQFNQMFRALTIHNALGIAANQLGYDNRVIIVKRNNMPTMMINPEIVETSNSRRAGREGCLSFPGKSVVRGRPKVVKVKYQDIYGGEFVLQFEQLASACVQHEIDHLNGKTMYDQ